MPHRLAPLAPWQVKGENLECPYHGLQFGGHGKCAFSPHNNGGVPALRVSSYPVVERHGAIWIWLSESAEPNLSTIPDLSDLMSYPATAVVDVPSMTVKAGYELIGDNLMDPTHADFVHLGKLGNGLHCTRRGSARVENGSVISEWTWEGQGPVPARHRRYLAPRVRRPARPSATSASRAAP